MAKLLVDSGANVNLKSRHNETAVHKRVVDGDYEGLCLLLEAKADPGASTTMKLCPLELAIIGRKRNMIDLFLQYAPSSYGPGRTFRDIVYYAAQKNLEIAASLFEKKSDELLKDVEFLGKLVGLFGTKLHREESFIKFLRTCSIPVDTKDENGDTLLLRFSMGYFGKFTWTSSHAFMTALIQLGADVNATDKKLQRTPLLHLASLCPSRLGPLKRQMFMRLLIEANADVNHMDKNGDTAVRLIEDHDAFAMLLYEGADIDVDMEHPEYFKEKNDADATKKSELMEALKEMRSVHQVIPEVLSRDIPGIWMIHFQILEAADDTIRHGMWPKAIFQRKLGRRVNAWKSDESLLLLGSAEIDSS
eukprot:CAMPEP_0167743520 /NCGR_PEP_ID=MMETSP0110_2-20121227/2060_1 /TAXON_ID=629695 /ORGANISM="Gymnochlora sp., Strain CCMP2014" /LENGTH=361 /DNA_ID=CAMNT_0007627897 /DNA_START=103 /DNA_END=1188 /DNA_ORIENTATION=+